MKNSIIISLSLAALLPAALLSAEYRIVGQRHLRLYTAAEKTQSYNASVDAQTVADSLCNVPWTRARAANATSTAHVNERLDENVTNRDLFDAALFCADHTGGTHRAYANAAVYRYRLPDGPLPNLTRLSARVSSDPYNAFGARLVLYTNATGEIPTDCATCRGENPGGLKLSGLAPRITRRVVEGANTQSYWYPATTNAVFDLSASPLALQRYLFVFVVLENYATARGNWLEGCSYMENLVSVTTDAPVPGWIEGTTVDLSTNGGYSAAPDEWMPYFETTNTIVTAVSNGVSRDFSAPAFAFRLVHCGSTNLSFATHEASRFDGETWIRGEKVPPNISGWTVTRVLPARRVAVTGRDVFLERGFEVSPPSRGVVKSDADGDGIPDGWEIYVGSDPLDPSDAVSDWDGDGLSLAEEYDHGHFPTNPHSVDSDGDGVLDGYAFRYHLKGTDELNDADGDGLSNYAEYVLSEVFKVARLDPDNANSSDGLHDYFRKLGDLYLGEIVTDHDQMADEWEARFPPDVLSGSAYDPLGDYDNDGWSNFAEFKAGTDPSDFGSHPVPSVIAKVSYVGANVNLGKVFFKAWSEKTSFGMTEVPDAVWTSGTYGLRPNGICRLDEADLVAAGAKSRGHVSEGLNTFVCFADADGNGEYTPGEPFGVVRGVDVGWQGAQFEVQLTDTTAASPRLALWPTVASDRETKVDGFLASFDLSNVAHVGDYRNYPGLDNAEKAANYLAAMQARVDTTRLPEEKKTKIRVVRYGIDGFFSYQCGVGSEGDGYNQRVVLEKTYDPSTRTFISEQDFFGPGQFDLDWDTLQADGVVNTNGVPVKGTEMAGCSVTNMTYLVVIGDGKKDFRGGDDTNTVRALAQVVTRRFEKVRHNPVIDATHTMFYCARPTFRWSMPNEEAWAKAFGSTYTAFKLQILETDNSVVYDSGLVRAPATDANGTFVWTAPVCTGSQTANGKVFEPLKQYKWKVSMYNAKFRSDSWSNVGQFTMDVNRQQKVNDHDFSAIDVAVKYTGPARVLEKHQDLAGVQGTVRVQAFATADFSGEPLAETFVTNAVADATNAFANATLVGLPVGQTYYVRAYVDSNGNLRKDAWESWGRADQAVTLSLGDKVAPTVGLFIEDADTDGDWLPDAWEYAIAGWTGDFDDVKNIRNARPSADGVIAVTDNLLAALNGKTLDAGVSAGLPGVSLTTFQNVDYAKLLLGISSGNRTTLEAIRDAVEAKVGQ